MLLRFATPSTKPFLPLSKLNGFRAVMELFIFGTVGYEGRAMITMGWALPTFCAQDLELRHSGNNANFDRGAHSPTSKSVRSSRGCSIVGQRKALSHSF